MSGLKKSAAVLTPARALSSLPASHSQTGHSDQLGMTSDRTRQAMIDRLKAAGVNDPEVLQALKQVPRHRFVEEGLASRAYEEVALPIGFGQTISQPYIVARMLELARHGERLNKVLEIGTGCGYQAAVIAQIALEVYSIERIKGLHELARVCLRPYRLSNLRLVHGDGMIGLIQAAPFDAIILAAAGLEIPQELLTQLTVGGRLIAPIGQNQQFMYCIERISLTEWRRHKLEEVRFVPLQPGVV